MAHAPQLGHPWITCEAVLAETWHTLKRRDGGKVVELLRRGVLSPRFDLGDNLESVLDLVDKYQDVPMSVADACLVRMSEIFPDPVVITTDSHFTIYRRHSRQVIPCLMP